MYFVSPTLIGAAAVAVALSFTPVYAEQQQGGQSTGNPSAQGSNGGGNHPSGAMGAPSGGLDQPSAAAGDSDQMSPGAGKGKKSAEAAPSEGQSGKGAKAGNDNGMPTGQDSNAAVKGDKEKGKTAEGATSPEAKGKDAKSGGKTEGQDTNTAEGKSGTDENVSGKSKTGARAEGNSDTDENVSGKSKTGATAEGKGDGQDRPGKSVRLESNDVSKVRTHFSQHRPTASRIDRNQVSVSIGIAIPSAIVLYDLPPDVIVVSGACPIKYFVWEDDIVLVDSCTHEVVEIISGIA